MDELRGKSHRAVGHLVVFGVVYVVARALLRPTPPPLINYEMRWPTVVDRGTRRVSPDEAFAYRSWPPRRPRRGVLVVLVAAVAWAAITFALAALLPSLAGPVAAVAMLGGVVVGGCAWTWGSR